MLVTANGDTVDVITIMMAITITYYTGTTTTTIEMVTRKYAILTILHPFPMTLVSV